MANELVRQESGIAQYTGGSLDETLGIAKILAQSGFFQDAKDVAQACVKILCGAEVGLKPVQSMMGVYIVKGKPSFSAVTIASLIKQSGRYNYKVLRLDKEGCEIEFFEKQNGEWVEMGVSAFTVEDARKAQVSGPNWQHYPRNMFFARALTNGARWYTPDVFGGAVYTPEELGGNENGDSIEAPIQAMNIPDSPSSPKPVDKDWTEPNTNKDERTGRPGAVPTGGTIPGSNQDERPEQIKVLPTEQSKPVAQQKPQQTNGAKEEKPNRVRFFAALNALRVNVKQVDTVLAVISHCLDREVTKGDVLTDDEWAVCAERAEEFLAEEKRKQQEEAQGAGGETVEAEEEEEETGVEQSAVPPVIEAEIVAEEKAQKGEEVPAEIYECVSQGCNNPVDTKTAQESAKKHGHILCRQHLDHVDKTVASNLKQHPRMQQVVAATQGKRYEEATVTTAKPNGSGKPTSDAPTGVSLSAAVPPSIARNARSAPSQAVITPAPISSPTGGSSSSSASPEALRNARLRFAEVAKEAGVEGRDNLLAECTKALGRKISNPSDIKTVEEWEACTSYFTGGGQEVPEADEDPFVDA